MLSRNLIHDLRQAELVCVASLRAQEMYIFANKFTSYLSYFLQFCFMLLYTGGAFTVVPLSGSIWPLITSVPGPVKSGGKKKMLIMDKGAIKLKKLKV